MSIRITLVPVFGHASDARSLEAAFGVARRFGAHVNGLFVRIDPRDAIPVIGEGVSPAVIDQLTEAAAAEMDRRSAAGRKTFDTACGKSAIAMSDKPSGTASAGWIELTGRRDVVIPKKARASDLTVLCRPDEHTPPGFAAVLEATLFGAGRPLLIVRHSRSRAIQIMAGAASMIGRNSAARALSRASLSRSSAAARRRACSARIRSTPNPS
jgi:hypothetical protein